MLTVLNVAYPFAPVGADAAGGAEQVLAQLDAALTTVALAAGCRANVPVLLAGQVYPYEAHEGYFRELIVRNLDRRRRFIGPISLARKRRLLAAARCLLAPSVAPETSSLVAMEALASGTPVIAFPSGALPEIVMAGPAILCAPSVKWPMPFAKSIASIPRSVELSRRAVSAEPNDAPVPRSL